jgi:cell division protein FtsB
MAARKKRSRRLGGPIVRRWFAIGAFVLVGLLYYRPIHTYLAARSQRAVRVTAVRQLEKEQAVLKARLKHASSDAALAAAARSLGYVRPGDHLYIVKDIPQWRHRQHASGHAASRGDGR